MKKSNKKGKKFGKGKTSPASPVVTSAPVFGDKQVSSGSNDQASSPPSPPDWVTSMSPIATSTGAVTPEDAVMVDQTSPVDSQEVLSEVASVGPPSNGPNYADLACTENLSEEASSSEIPSDVSPFNAQVTSLDDAAQGGLSEQPASLATDTSDTSTTDTQMHDETTAAISQAVGNTLSPLINPVEVALPPSPTIVPDPTTATVNVTGSSFDLHKQPNAAEGGTRTTRYSTTPTVPPSVPVDILERIPSMYRILDLVSEPGSGGLVDKIVISQESLGRFVNDVCPGAYESMTHIDFTILDRVSMKPLGVYGSKSEIVRYMEDLGLVDSDIAEFLRIGKDVMLASQTLRAGLYLLRDKVRDLVYVIFWPQDTTWDDHAMSSVARNRVTFMRYLSKIADQTVALIADEHARDLILVDTDGASDSALEASDYEDSEDEDDDRLFTFEVTKTREEDENVTASPGFEVPNLPLGDRAIVDDAMVEPALLRPQLIAGETSIGLLTVAYEKVRQKSKPKSEDFYSTRLVEFVKRSSFRLEESLTEDGLNTLIDSGLAAFVEDVHQELVLYRKSARAELQKEEMTALDKVKAESSEQNAYIVDGLCMELAAHVSSMASIFTVNDLRAEDGQTENNADPINATELLDHLSTLHPEINSLRRDLCTDTKLKTITVREFLSLKMKVAKQQTSQGGASTTRPDVANVDSHDNGTSRSWVSVAASGVTSSVKAVAGLVASFTPPPTFSAQHSSSTRVPSDVEFLSMLPTMAEVDPTLTTECQEAITAARRYFMTHIAALAHKGAHKIAELRVRECKRQLQTRFKHIMALATDSSRRSFILATQGSFIRDPDRVFIVQKVEKVPWVPGQFRLSGIAQSKSEASLTYAIHVLAMSEVDNHGMQMDVMYVPRPRILASPHTFSLALRHKILHIQLVEDCRCLLITRNETSGDVSIYLERLIELDLAVKQSRTRKLFRSEKLRGNILFTYDESKRLLGLCTVEKFQIHVFVFDEPYKSLTGLGTVVDLSAWYSSQAVITQIVFRGGAQEEILIIDGGTRARVLSLTTQQFRPASLQLPQAPCAVKSSPDGACFFSFEVRPGGTTLHAYHWASFGSSQGISVDLHDGCVDSLAVTSFAGRARCHAIVLDASLRHIRSTALHITHKSTEFSFKADARNTRRRAGESVTIHNSLIDCHRDVWEKYPVVPAVSRQTFKSSLREPRSLTFVSSPSLPLFSQYYSQLVETFQRATRKPIDEELSSIIVTGEAYSDFVKRSPNISLLRAGEWLVELLCLIPIHIAVARDNHFVPLKDGVHSNEFERALLGATVEQVVDQLSFGWYESIFQSYMAKKPVRVVSSMGEQSVGKSFALNHLVDTSFAGSAMRTTEGVWMSVTPTDTCLIVALDFEGVHSIERSAQEDSLLVLFNTAISNLVLFRNNFALSRDIAGLFQSFQSSAMVLDPAANPTLFRSELVIIIKDVVPSDKKEITKEFSLKFQQIVEVEQEGNFISRLHGGKLAIIPWPVISSPEFYASFTTVKKRLDKRPISHERAGVFLQTIKTLMAKLKTNDWGSLDQNLAKHRALQLQSSLHVALRFGASEIEPDFEPLKDIDNGIPLELPHAVSSVFYLPRAEDAMSDEAGLRTGEHYLKQLQRIYSRPRGLESESEEQWVGGLDAYLEHCARARIEDVQHWLDVNTARFTSDPLSFQALRREFEACSVSLRAEVQLCKLQCAECHLYCIKARHHDGPHHCETDHKCSRPCWFAEDHGGEAQQCGLPAGHAGNHICDISAHLCGKPCRLAGKVGCLERCSKVADQTHEDHLCQASAHECGKPCGLNGIPLPDGSLYNCHETCHVSIEQEHGVHVCKRQSCPLYCQLCRRLCSEPNHLHGLDRDAVHLCGQEHTCVALCQSDGICRIETTPQSVEATFTGRHDTFQYTKYSQESKRLQCVIPIPASAVTHDDPHRHSTDPNPFHYCEMRCQNCGYFCTLPRGHTQQEHETSHGSMSKTKWAVEDGSVVEVNGRKFGSNDDGAPLLCSMVCQQMGRHVHVDFCRTTSGACTGANHQHITVRMLPEPAKAKDFVSHELYWRRTGFKDPYSHDDRETFAKCDAMCSGREHQGDANTPAQPSFCTQPMFHAPLNSVQGPPGGVGYISGDGHHFSCRNPALLQQAFHVIFVIDRSGSMAATDRRPLNDTPASARIAARHNNRIGAVYSSLFAFWSTRHAVANGNANRRDAYSVILFHGSQTATITNDFTSTPDQLLNTVLGYQAGGGTDYNIALVGAQAVMENNWSTERTPVLIFLSDGECSVNEGVMRTLCRRAVALGRALSFHAVAFGPHNDILRRMADIAAEVQRAAPADPMHPAVPSSYVEALDSVRLAETFLGIANSLTKPRGGLMHG